MFGKLKVALGYRVGGGSGPDVRHNSPWMGYNEGSLSLRCLISARGYVFSYDVNANYLRAGVDTFLLCVKSQRLGVRDCHFVSEQGEWNVQNGKPLSVQ